MQSLMLFAAILAIPARALIIPAEEIGISKMIPREGEPVRWVVPVYNDTEEPVEAEVTVTMRSGRRGEVLGPPVAASRTVRVAGGKSEDFVFDWTAPRNGYYRAVFEIAGTDQRAEREVAVTRDDLWFVWFGAPKGFRWCNVPTTVRDEDQAWWLRRGAIPAHWKGGVCNREWSVEQFVQDWGATDWIAIDEVGGPGEDTDKFIAAWKQLKQQKPHQWIAVWYMGAHAYWRDIADLIDLFVPEIYLNYFGNHLGRFDAYFRVAREAGVMEQVIPGLGINEIKDKQGRITVSPTRADVLRQFRYLKRTAPELKGIGFFTAYSAAPGVAEYADALCEEYYIKPVLTVCNLAQPIRLTGKPGDEMRTASVVARNVGGMDAENVRVEWRWGWEESGEARVRSQVVTRWPVGEELTFTHEVSRGPGWAPLEFRIIPGEGYTVLDGVAREWVIRPPAGWEPADVAVIPAAAGLPVPLPEYVAVRHEGSLQVAELEPGLRRQTDMPCAVLPPRPGVAERLAVLPAAPRADRPRVLLLKPGAGAAAPGPQHTREGQLLTVTTDHYRAELNLATDEMVALGPAGGMENVLQAPWSLAASGHEGFGEAKLQELPGCLVVTVPFDSAQASGESQYVFLAYSPVIRIARSWAPKGEVKLGYAGERCGLFQKAGTYALQGGVGGPVQRGRLHDSDQYRDLLFGYLGSRPGPDNADRAGWLDFSYGAPDANGGLGVAIDYRWQDADTKEYDVTRLYDASDWIEVLHLWGREKVFSRPQISCVYLIPHKAMDLADAAVVPPARVLWERVHARQLAAGGE